MGLDPTAIAALLAAFLMKVLLLCAPVALLSFASSLQADLTITQKTDSPGSKGTVTMKVKGSKVRIDNAGASSTIVETLTGEMQNLDHEKKQVESGNLHKGTHSTDLKAAISAANKGRPKPLGIVEKLGDQDCDLYEWDMGGLKAKLWVARSYPQQEQIKTEMAPLAALGNNLALADLPGVVVRTEMNLGGAHASTVLESVKMDPLPDTDFAIPTDYKFLEKPKVKK